MGEMSQIIAQIMVKTGKRAQEERISEKEMKQAIPHLRRCRCVCVCVCGVGNSKIPIVKVGRFISSRMGLLINTSDVVGIQECTK